MTRSVVGSRRPARRTLSAGAARLTRYDYTATTLERAQAGADLSVVFFGPREVSVAMRAPYAAELLRQLRGARKLRRGECRQISIDCPVEIVMDAAMQKALIAKLEGEVSVDACPRRGCGTCHRRA